MRIREKIRGTRTGLLTKLIVYHGVERVGIGFAVSFDDMHYRPVLSTINGEELPPDWYTLEATEQQLVVVSLTRQ